MGKINKALKKLLTKCTEQGAHPSGDSTGDILACIAEHYNTQGEKGEQGEQGEKGATGAYVTAIALTTTEGAVTGGTATMSDGTTVAITVSEAE